MPKHKNVRKRVFCIFLFTAFVVLIFYEFRVLSVKKYSSPSAAVAITVINKSRRNASYNRQISIRSQHLKKECKNKKLRVSSSLQNILVFDQQDNKSKLIFCPVFKAASSTLFAYLLEASKSNPDSDYHKNVGDRKMTPLEQIWEISHPLTDKSSLDSIRDGSKTAIIVRHPFERLVSAFRDKWERRQADLQDEDFERGFYYNKVNGHLMTGMFRKSALRRFGGEFFGAGNNYGALIPSKRRNSRRLSQLPIFWEFVQFVKTQNVRSMDVHYRPAYYGCAPCVVKYDYVFRVEDLDIDEDLKGLLDANLNNIGEKNVHEGGLNSEQITRIYFSTLSHSDIIKLWEIYKEDFLLFGYGNKFGNITFTL